MRHSTTPMGMAPMPARRSTPGFWSQLIEDRGG
jgi:hypothetical protein